MMFMTSFFDKINYYKQHQQCQHWPHVNQIVIFRKGANVHTTTHSACSSKNTLMAKARYKAPCPPMLKQVMPLPFLSAMVHGLLLKKVELISFFQRTRFFQ